ncbi:MAG: O-antigen ligase family protein, partial [Clostridia bacterium]|nr:O-antigen ligase family protein [Clostridia bacterium]
MKRPFPRPQAVLYTLCVAAAGFGDCSLLGGRGMALKALTLCFVPAAFIRLCRSPRGSERREAAFFALLFACPLLFSLLHSLLLWSFRGADMPFVLRAGQKLLFQAAALAAALSAFQRFGSKAADYTFYGLALSNAAVIVLSALSASPSAVLLGLTVGPLVGLGGEAGDFQTNIELHDITFCMGLFILHYALHKPCRGHRRAHVAAAIFFFLAGLKRIAVLGLLLALLACVFLRAACRRPFPRSRLLLFSGVLVLLSFAYLLAIRAGLVTWALEALGIGMTGRDKIYRYVQPMYSLSPAFMGLGFQYTVALLRGMRDAGTQQIMVTGLHSDVLTLYIEMGFFGFFAVMGYWLAVLPARLGSRFGLGAHRAALCIQLYLLITYLTDNTMYYFFLTLVSRLLLMHAAQEEEAPLCSPRFPRPSPCPAPCSPPIGRKSAAMFNPVKVIRRAFVLCAAALCAALLCLGAQSVYDARHADAVLTLRSLSSPSGKRIDGTRFDALALFDDEVLGEAVSRAALSDDVTVSELKAALRVTPAVTREAEAAYVSAEYIVSLAHRDAPALLRAITSACLEREARRLAGSMAGLDAPEAGDDQALKDALLAEHIRSRALEAPDFSSGGDSFSSLASDLRAGVDIALLRERAKALENAFLAERMPLSFRENPRSSLWRRLPLLCGCAAAAAVCLVLAVRRLFSLRLVRPLRRAAALLLVSNALLGGAFLAWNAGRQVYRAEALVSAYGSLHPSELLSPQTVYAAINRLGVACGVEDIRSRVSIEPLIPEDEQTRRRALLETGESYDFKPTDFVVSFCADGELARLCGMGGSRLARLTLDALIAEWIESQAQREAAAELAQALPPVGTQAEQRLLSLAQYAEQLADSAGAWRCYDTGLSFPALSLRAEYALSQGGGEVDELDSLLRATAAAYTQRRLMTQVAVRSSTHVTASGGLGRRAALFASFLLVGDGMFLFLA